MSSVYFNTDGVNLARRPVDTLDFRQGMWGHRLHSSTFREEPAPQANLILSLLGLVRKARHYSFMVHSNHHPRVGQKVVWKGSQGDVEGILYDYECCGNPRDMFTLFVEVTTPLPTVS